MLHYGHYLSFGYGETKIISLEWQDFIDKGMSYYDAVIAANLIPNQRVRDSWGECLAMVKLTAYHTRACARATRECAYYTQVVVDGTRKEIGKQGQFVFSFVRREE